MPLTGVYGKGGSGKNTIVAYFIVKYFPNLKVYVNFNLYLPNAEKIDSIKLFELPETDKPIIVIWDEAYTEIENREFMSDQNRINSYLLFQARKNNMSIISICQLNILDVRWRGLEENCIFCYDRPIYDRKFKPFKGDFHYAFVKGNKITKFTLKYNDAKKVFPFFDTKQKILPKNFQEMKDNIMLRNPKEKLKHIDSIADRIRKECDLEKITHDSVKNAMLELEYVDFKFEPYVYVRLKAKEK